MGKRARHELVDETLTDFEDRISQLPDEVLVSILSLLSMREACRTSVLSHQWNKLWTFIYALNFDGSRTLDEVARGWKSKKCERARFVSWVNQVLDLHQSPSVHEFRVRYYFGRSYRTDIDRWIHFALEKRVKRLELDLSDYQTPCEYYSFPRPLDLTSCTSLIVLRLISVNVTGKVLECFLSSCLYLEHLSVDRSQTLVTLKVARSVPQLKYLEISHCCSLEKVEIFAANLLSLKYHAPWIRLPFKNFPNLATISVGSVYCEHVIRDFFHLSSYFSKLETIKLEFFLEENMEFLEFPCLSELRQLELFIVGRDDLSILGFTSFIEASPFLHKFTLKYSISEKSHRRRKINKATKRPHEHLKVVEVVGFVGRSIDVEFTMYFMENAVTLEKVILDPRNPYEIGEPLELKEKPRRNEQLGSVRCGFRQNFLRVLN